MHINHTHPHQLIYKQLIESDSEIYGDIEAITM